MQTNKQQPHHHTINRNNNTFQDEKMDPFESGLVKTWWLHPSMANTCNCLSLLFTSITYTWWSILLHPFNKNLMSYYSFYYKYVNDDPLHIFVWSCTYMIKMHIYSHVRMSIYRNIVVSNNIWPCWFKQSDLLPHIIDHTCL